MNWLQSIVAFFSGVLVACFAAISTGLVQKRNAKRKKIEDASFSIYMKLLEIYGLYFWAYSAEVRCEKLDPEINRKIRPLAMRITDELRLADDIPQIEQIVQVLFSRTFKTAKERYDALRSVLDKLGKTVSPRYQKIISQIDKENLQHMNGDMIFTLF